MARTLSILKPHVKNLILNNDIKEKATYLDVPEELSIRTLKEDIKKGAVQFQQLQGLMEKENKPQYILISTDNLEMGYLAVSYLAAGFNKKQNPNIRKNDDIEDLEYMEEWEEDLWRIPIIKENELKQKLGEQNEPFSTGQFFMQGNQRMYETKPYWMGCRNYSVCIVSSPFEFTMGFASNDTLHDSLDYFHNNDKIYILNVMEKREWETDDYEEDWRTNAFGEREKWNSIVLSYAADELEVKLNKENKMAYYKAVLKGIFRQEGIKTVKGFSYDKILNMSMCMKEKNKCQLLENIVNYATKDWTKDHLRIISIKDFAFMDRFIRTEENEKNKDGSKMTAKDRLQNQLIGMEQVKEQVLNVVNVMKFNRIRADMNIKGSSYHNVHIMLGAPGTAKTTVAQLMGQIMVEEHLLPDNRFACVNGAELKGMYVGHSAPKTKALFEENDIIVIDEAYSLVSDTGENDSFSKEAIAQLIIELENHSMDKLVIFAGYGGEKVSAKNNKMKAFLDANPGIKSRITSTIYFDSYNPKEMKDIFFQIAKNQNYYVEQSVESMLEAYFSKRMQAEDFGNGREARSLLETSVIFAAKRLFALDKKKYTRSDMQNLTEQDVKNAILYMEKANRIQQGCENKNIGFYIVA